MKKKIVLLLSALAVLAIMLGVYFAKTSADKKKAAEEAAKNNVDALEQLEQTGIRLTECNEKDIDNIVLNNGNTSIKLVKDNKGWVSADHKDYEYNDNALQTVVYCFTSLFAANEVTENAENLQQYGLDKPVVIGQSLDKKGNTQVIKLGTSTPDNNYYYAMVNDDPRVYIIDALAGKSLMYTYDDILDKSIDRVDSDSVTELEIKKQGSDDILVVFDNEDKTSQAYHNTVGLAALTMKKPFENMLVYPYNLESAVLYNLSQLNIGTLADPAPTDLNKYGLEQPYLSFSVKDIDGKAVSVKVGNEAAQFADDETTYYYALFDDKPQVFTVDKRAIKPFEEAKVVDFIQNFITLHKRSDVEKLTINAGDKAFEIIFASEGENTFVTDDEGTKRDNRNTYINGKLIDKDTFSDFYESVCGLAFDEIADDAQDKAKGEPNAAITFDLLDGSTDKAEYYDYNESFYAVKKADNCSMLINKQAVNKLIADVERLAEE